MGRTSTYTEAIAAEICERLASGESLRAICRDERMPPHPTVLGWVLDDLQGFADQYARARAIGLDVVADDLLDIADTPVIGEETEDDGDKVKVKRGDMLGHRKLQVDTRKWYLSKLAPKKYGDKQAVELSGSLAVTDMSDDEIRAELAALTAGGVLPSGDDVSDLV